MTCVIWKTDFYTSGLNLFYFAENCYHSHSIPIPCEELHAGLSTVRHQATILLNKGAAVLRNVPAISSMETFLLCFLHHLEGCVCSMGGKKNKRCFQMQYMNENLIFFC